MCQKIEKEKKYFIINFKEIKIINKISHLYIIIMKQIKLIKW